MATETATDHAARIGDVAGTVWRVLHENGPTPQTKLLQQVDAPRDLVLQGLGWLAREGKLQFEQRARGRAVSVIVSLVDKAS